MCGIFIAFDIDGLPESQHERMRAAVHVAAHRGPDNLGIWHDANCFLGHNRLSILDLDSAANQPFACDGLELVYNGELFNYEELRLELKALGHSFSTNSDTEVVLHAYIEWGASCFAMFNGMWALAIYDSKRRELVVSRDRFGQKPLFISRDGSRVLVASEFQQLAGLVEKRIDYGLIQMFLKEGTYEGNGRTFLETIQEFPKAHYLTIDASGTWRSEAYWHYPSYDVASTDQGSIDAFSELLSDAVRLRLRADVPFGVLVSGGVDSTVIAHYAREHTGPTGEIPAFTFSSRDQFDERVFAQAVADRLDLDLHVRVQDQESLAYKARLKKLVQHLGRGHSSPAIVSVDYLYEAVASAGVRVALDGQGADELLAGYKNYFLLVIPHYLARGELRQAWLSLRDQLKFGFLSAVILFLRNVLPPPLRAVMRRIYGYERLFKTYRQNRLKRWVDVKDHVGRNSNFLNRYLIWHHNLGLENLLYYGDIIAMRNSVENRSPFMDHRLVEFAFRYDDKLKLHNAIDKNALRASAIYSEYRDVLDRDKIGFSSDILPSTKESMIEDLQSSPILDWPIFADALTGFIHSEALMRAKYERFLFRLYQVHLWNEIFVDSPASARADVMLPII